MIRFKGVRPPCPDPNTHSWVQMKNGDGYWRRKRAPIPLNKEMTENKDTMKKVSPFNSSLVRSMDLLLHQIDTKRLHNKMNKYLLSYQRVHGNLDMAAFKGMNFPDETLESCKPGLVRYEIDPERSICEVVVPQTPHLLKPPGRGFVGYRWGMALVYLPKNKKKDGPKLLVDYSVKQSLKLSREETRLAVPFSTKDFAWWMLCLRLEFFLVDSRFASFNEVRMTVLDSQGKLA